MQLFSELYNCYYQVVKSILIGTPVLNEEILRNKVNRLGYEESVLFLIPKLMSGDWNLLKKEDGILLSKLSDDFYVPLSNLQLSFLKALLQDKKTRLFLSEEQITCLGEAWAEIPPLWQTDDFYYYDRFADSDDYTDSHYIHVFRALLTAIKNKQQVDVSYRSKTGNMISTRLLPSRLEYSMKNDKFRLLAIQNRSNMPPRLHILNVDRIEDVVLLIHPSKRRGNLSRCIKQTYYKDPAKIIIKNERNALERAMLQFANYEKNTKKIDQNTYECLIYYNKNVETELLIELMSFGPMIKVVGNDDILAELKARLQLQQSLFSN